MNYTKIYYSVIRTKGIDGKMIRRFDTAYEDDIAHIKLQIISVRCCIMMDNKWIG